MESPRFRHLFWYEVLIAQGGKVNREDHLEPNKEALMDSLRQDGITSDPDVRFLVRRRGTWQDYQDILGVDGQLSLDV